MPTLPPHITFEQARNFATALPKGDEHEGGIVRQAVKQMVAKLTPGDSH